MDNEIDTHFFECSDDHKLQNFTQIKLYKKEAQLDFKINVFKMNKKSLLC